tara:strand:- start:738021 stop:738569 length:549 start_codon:yes stop_codon:yes gene_type:complete
MKHNKPFLILVFTLFLGLMSFQIAYQFPSNIQKKIKKEITASFQIEDYRLEQVVVSDNINSRLKSSVHKKSLFKIVFKNQLLGYAFIDKASSKTDEFDYLVLFDSELIIKKAKVLVYREDYGGEIGSKRWLMQFIGKTSEDRLKYEKDIIAISGATISANSMTVAINNVLIYVDELHKYKVL